ncbi:hypothetical protein LTR36_002151 [Oleoguttula mirabilis]|uniref:Ankyrin repeat protein n=1 Tax=Oleoguttula mirabilis TaxID=1507867 RepID=A0AAV9JN93_9PEZI|nr:hypothetical protein LTR36_002151 [Oleoguttula mirabilis]
MKAKTVDVAKLLIEHGADLHATDNQKKTALMYARSQEVVNLFISKGADLEARDFNGNTALMISLMEDQDTKIAELLIELGADIKATDDMKRTVLDTAVWRNRVPVVKALIDKGVDLGRKDDRERTVWHHLAMDTERRLEEDGGPSEQIVKLLLGATDGNNVLDARDSRFRTSLHWAVGSGNLLVARALLESNHVDVNATEHRSRTALHLAVKFAAELETDLADLDLMLTTLDAEIALITKKKQLRHGSHLSTSGVLKGPDTITEERVKRHQEQLRKQKDTLKRVKSNQAMILDLLLKQGAINIDAEADDGWTPLHTTCASRVSLDALNKLLSFDVKLNKKTQTSKTAFHLACEAGNIEAVTRLLAIPTTLVDTKDNFGNTPLLGAVACGHRTIVNLLAPWTQRHIDSLSKEARGAAEKFHATVIDFGSYKRGKLPAKPSVFDVLYSNPTTVKDSGRDSVSTMCPPGGRTDFRWIHLPVNNVSWCQELLTKRFIEEGAGDVEGFKILERSFLHQHRGRKVHSRYMRPMCRTVPRSARRPEAGNAGAGTQAMSADEIAKGAAEHQWLDSDMRPSILRTDATTTNTSNILALARDQRRTDSLRRSSTAVSDEFRWPQQRSLTMDSQRSAAQSDVEKPGYAAQGAIRDPPAEAENNVFLFAPYLHFETDARRREMQEALKQAESAANTKGMSAAADALVREPQHEDELLLKAHLGSSTLHIRRTLDQFFYRTIDTAFRDATQVVYKHLEEHAKIAEDLKVLMVDQLWMWILGDDLVITSFPQRWRQPPRDPLNVLESVMEEINSPTANGIGNVYELATLIAGRCFETFDRSDIRPEGSRFLDMFESTIGKAMDDETELFRRFNRASKQLSIFLQDTKHWSSLRHKEDAAVRAAVTDSDYKAESPGGTSSDREPEAIQALLDIDSEIKLWTKVKDVRDELDMLRMVFEQQKQVVPGLRESLDTVFGSNKGLGGERGKIKKRLGYHERAIDHSIQEVDRMDKQARRIYDSIRDLLDLKQKHANAFEASYARIQAAETARQGQTLFVFTVVTVIFLPLSFIAAFFALDVQEFPHQGDNQEMPLSYVSKWVFGIGISIALLCVLAALSVDKIVTAYRTMQDWISATMAGPSQGSELHGSEVWDPVAIAAKPFGRGPTKTLRDRVSIPLAGRLRVRGLEESRTWDPVAITAKPFGRGPLTGLNLHSRLWRSRRSDKDVEMNNLSSQG